MSEQQNGPKTFQELLLRSAAYGDASALTNATTERSLSFRELASEVEWYCQRLPSHIAPGSRVILYGLDPLDWVLVFFASVQRGFVVVPLDTRVSSDFIASVEELTNPELLIVGDDVTLATTKNILRVSQLRERAAQQISLPTSKADAPAEILFTSGTWSRPKGVVLSQKNILTNVQQVLSVYPHKVGDTSLAVLPLSHAYQQTVGLILPLLCGSHVVFLSAVNSAALVGAIQKYSVRTMLVVPRVLSLLQNSILRNIKKRSLRPLVVAIIKNLRFIPRSLRRLVLSSVHKKMGISLSTFIVGGAPLDPELDHFFQGLGYFIVVGYGASECAPVISISLDQKREAGEVGIILPHMEVRQNEKEELVVSGENVFLGYWPELDLSRTFNTEDVGEQTKRGTYLLKGRTKNLIVYPNGDKIFSEDIEYLVKQIDGVEDCCVSPLTVGNDVRLYCLAKKETGRIIEVAPILDLVNNQLPFGIKLEDVFFAEGEDFPYTHTLKVNRKKVQEMITSEAA